MCSSDLLLLRLLLLLGTRVERHRRLGLGGWGLLLAGPGGRERDACLRRGGGSQRENSTGANEGRSADRSKRCRPACHIVLRLRP